ncbi:unnamed protein product [Lampetra planeri]
MCSGEATRHDGVVPYVTVFTTHVTNTAVIDNIVGNARGASPSDRRAPELSRRGGVTAFDDDDEMGGGG